VGRTIVLCGLPGGFAARAGLRRLDPFSSSPENLSMTSGVRRLETVARLLPWDETNSSTVDLVKTPADFFLPGFHSDSVNFLIEAPDQGVDQHGAGCER
jgi:hypothetical protein